MKNRRVFREMLMNQIRSAYYRELEERDRIADALRGMGWTVDEIRPETRPDRDADYFRNLSLCAFEYWSDNAPSIEVTWERSGVSISATLEDGSVFLSEELDVADDENGQNSSGSYGAVLRMVKDAVDKLNNR